MKKISLVKSLALLGAVGLTSVCVVETALLLHKNSEPQISDTIDLNAYDGYTLAHIIENAGDPDMNEIALFLKNDGIQLTDEAPTKFNNINDLEVNVYSATKTFSVTAKTNSPDYVGSSSAIIHYATPDKTDIATIIDNNTKIYIDNKYEDENITKSKILNSLSETYSNLNINQLSVNIIGGYATSYDISIQAKTNSLLYIGAVNASYETSGAVTFSYNTNTLLPGNTATPTFKYHQNIVTATYIINATISAPLTWNQTAGTLIYSSVGIDFAGGAYEVTATYTLDTNTYIARQLIYVPTNVKTTTLTLSTPNITTSVLNTGTSTFKLAGVTTSPTSYSISPALPSGQGLQFSTSTGQLSWNGTTITTGGTYVITANYEPQNQKAFYASATANVAPCRDFTTVASQWNADMPPDISNWTQAIFASVRALSVGNMNISFQFNCRMNAQNKVGMVYLQTNGWSITSSQFFITDMTSTTYTNGLHVAYFSNPSTNVIYFFIVKPAGGRWTNFTIDAFTVTSNVAKTDVNFETYTSNPAITTLVPEFRN